MLNREFIIIFIGKLLSVIIGVVSIKVLTTVLSSHEIGKIYIIISIVSFFTLFFINPFTQYFFRLMNYWKSQNQLTDVLILMIIYLFVISILVPLVFLFNIVNDLKIEYIVLILFGFAFFQNLNLFIIPLLNMLHFRLSFIILTVLTAFCVIVFGYLFVKLFGNNAQNWLLGLILSNTIFAIIGFYLLKNRLNDKFHGFSYNLKKITKEKIKSLLIFIIPLSVATLFMWLQNSSYNFIVERYIGLEFLGILGVGFAVSSQVMNSMQSIVTQYYYPIYYKQITNSSFEIRKLAINELINKVLPVYLMLALFLTFLAKYVVVILVAKEFYSVYIFTIYGVWIEFFKMITNILGNISQSELKTNKFIKPYIFGSITTVCLVFFTSMNEPLNSYLPFGLLIGGLVTLIAMYFSMKQLIDFKINYRPLLLSLVLSSPYLIILLINHELSFGETFSVVLISGLYLLGTIYFIYKKGLSYGNS